MYQRNSICFIINCTIAHWRFAYYGEITVHSYVLPSFPAPG